MENPPLCSRLNWGIGDVGRVSCEDESGHRQAKGCWRSRPTTGSTEGTGPQGHRQTSSSGPQGRETSQSIVLSRCAFAEGVVWQWGRAMTQFFNGFCVVWWLSKCSDQIRSVDIMGNPYQAWIRNRRVGSTVLFKQRPHCALQPENYDKVLPWIPYSFRFTETKCRQKSRP